MTSCIHIEKFSLIYQTTETSLSVYSPHKIPPTHSENEHKRFTNVPLHNLVTRVASWLTLRPPQRGLTLRTLLPHNTPTTVQGVGVWKERVRWKCVYVCGVLITNVTLSDQIILFDFHSCNQKYQQEKSYRSKKFGNIKLLRLVYEKGTSWCLIE